MTPDCALQKNKLDEDTVGAYDTRLEQAFNKAIQSAKAVGFTLGRMLTKIAERRNEMEVPLLIERTQTPVLLL